jgi:hypothetical protein
MLLKGVTIVVAVEWDKEEKEKREGWGGVRR